MVLKLWGGSKETERDLGEIFLGFLIFFSRLLVYCRFTALTMDSFLELKLSKTTVEDAKKLPESVLAENKLQFF